MQPLYVSAFPTTSRPSPMYPRGRVGSAQAMVTIPYEIDPLNLIAERTSRMAAIRTRTGVIAPYEDASQLDIAEGDLVFVPRNLGPQHVSPNDRSAFSSFNGFQRYTHDLSEDLCISDYYRHVRCVGVATIHYPTSAKNLAPKAVDVQSQGTTPFVNSCNRIIGPGEDLTWIVDHKDFDTKFPRSNLNRRTDASTVYKGRLVPLVDALPVIMQDVLRKRSAELGNLLNAAYAATAAYAAAAVPAAQAARAGEAYAAYRPLIATLLGPELDIRDIIVGKTGPAVGKDSMGTMTLY